MALERSAMGNDAALCPLPAPQGWIRCGWRTGGGRFSRSPDPQRGGKGGMG